MLYELLTGTLPFTGDSPINVAFRHVNEDVPPPSAARAVDPPRGRRPGRAGHPTRARGAPAGRGPPAAGGARGPPYGPGRSPRIRPAHRWSDQQTIVRRPSGSAIPRPPSRPRHPAQGTRRGRRPERHPAGGPTASPLVAGPDRAAAARRTRRRGGVRRLVGDDRPVGTYSVRAQPRPRRRCCQAHRTRTSRRPSRPDAFSETTPGTRLVDGPRCGTRDAQGRDGDPRGVQGRRAVRAPEVVGPDRARRARP